MSHAVTDDSPDTNLFMSGVPLEQFLQLVEVDRKTCSVTVRSGDREGVLHFRDGAILDAAAGDLGGTKAAYEILSWEEDTEIAMQTSDPGVEQVIEEGIGFLVMESARFRDEGSRDQAEPEQAPVNELEETEPGDDDSPVVPFPGAAAEAVPEAAGEAEEEPDFDRDVMLPCLRIIDEAPGVEQVVFVMRDGTVLGDRGGGEELGTLLAYLAMEAQRVRQTLSVAGPHWISLNCTEGTRFVAVLGTQVVLGMVAKSSVSPQKLIAKLHPLIRSAIVD